ncbi:MAG: histidinol-phosphatase HisJ family protein [Lachnospiraceae bacterium]|nr:histidinol-phosphatase HisJ family protein [Lachnospiraceae bacterium]
MPIFADQHLHCSYSPDSKATMKEMAESAFSKGLKHISFTDHNDFEAPDYPEYPKGCWDLNVDSYLYEILKLREEYRDKMFVGFGIEIGLLPEAFRQNAVLAHSHEFDLVLGSVHFIDGLDIYDNKFFENRDIRSALGDYFRAIRDNIVKFNNFDVLAHMDMPTRVMPYPEDDYKPEEHKDIIDDILNYLIENEKGIELNMSSLSKGKKNPCPNAYILKRYKELGGEIVTVGSDAHRPEIVGTHFDVAADILADCGFKYYCTFENRTATFVKL